MSGATPTSLPCADTAALADDRIRLPARTQRASASATRGSRAADVFLADTKANTTVSKIDSLHMQSGRDAPAPQLS
jgi:hypothetical protein